MEQLDIVIAIYGSLISGEHSTNIVNGEPGTGKSVLAVYLAKYILQEEETKDYKIALVIPMTSLRKTLKKVFSKVKGLSSSMVIGPSEVVGNMFDLLIVDEAHRLRRRINLSSYQPYDKANKYYGLGNEGTQLDWIMQASKSQVLLYDQKQSIVPGDIRTEQIQELDSKHYHLSNQLRVKGGEDYIAFISSLLSNSDTNTINLKDYDLRYFININDMQKEIIRLDKKYGLARMVAGYAWK